MHILQGACQFMSSTVCYTYFIKAKYYFYLKNANSSTMPYTVAFLSNEILPVSFMFN